MACNQHICDLGIFHDFLENIDIETWNLNSSLSGKYMALRVFVAAELSFNCWGEMPISLEFADTGSDQKHWQENAGKGECLCAVCTALSYQK